MSSVTESSAEQRSSRTQFWTTFVCPTARELEGFGWRVLWAVVILKLLFFV